MRKYTRALFVGTKEEIFITCVWVPVRRSKIGNTETVLVAVIPERGGDGL
jgi:hypothetical protein